MRSAFQRPQRRILTLRGENLDESLSELIVATGCQVLAELIELNKKGWEDPSLDAQFEKWRNVSAHRSTPETAIAWLRTYCRSMHEMNRQLKFIPDGSVSFLDLGCAPGGYSKCVFAPGGYSKCVLETNPNAVGTGVCLPVREGGHLLMLPRYMRARYTAHYADMTKYNLRKGTRSGYPYPATLPACVVRFGHCVNYCYQRGKGRWDDIHQVQEVCLVQHRVRTLSFGLHLPPLETIKPRTVHANRGTFYAIARGVQRGEALRGYLNVLHQMRQELLENALDPGSIPRVYERITTLEQLKECYIPRLIELGTPVWEVQKEHLDWYIRNKGSGGSPKEELQGETDIQGHD